MDLNISGMIESFSILSYGMAGIFVAIGAIMLSIKIMQLIFK